MGAVLLGMAGKPGPPLNNVPRNKQLLGLPGMTGYTLIGYILPVLLLAISATDGQGVLITPRGHQVKAIGSGVIFTCTHVDASPSDRPDIMWIDPNGYVITAQEGRVYIERESNNVLKLYLRHIRRDDAGPYTCEVELGPGVLRSEDTAIVIMEKPEFDEFPKQHSFPVGSNPLLPCTASGQPEPEISWRFHRVRIPQSSDKYRHEKDGLRIFDLTPNDNGTYECRAEVPSQGQLKVTTISLNVQYVPTITVKPNSTSVILGASLTLQCQAKGNPPPEYEWYKEIALPGSIKEQQVSDIIKVKVKLGKGPDKTYHAINEADMEAEGRYFCIASNSLGSATEAADITVLVKPAIDKMPHKVQVEGDVMIMSCRATGKPIPEITWRHVGKGKPFTEGEQKDDNRISVDTTEPGLSKLIIRGIRTEDAGQYTCRATNDAGTIAKNGMLTIEYRPKILSEKSQTLGWPGQTRIFNCSAFGVPKPDITWFKRNQYIRDSDIYSVYGRRGYSVLQVLISEKSSGVYGSYTCMAKNIHGTATQNHGLRQANSPAMPRNITIVEEKMTNVTLMAMAPQRSGGLPVKSWMVRYIQSSMDRDDDDKKERTYFFGSSEKMTIDGLKPGTLYNFYLSAGNEVGFGKAAKFQVRTPHLTTTTIEPPSSSPSLFASNHSVLGVHQNDAGVRQSRHPGPSEEAPPVGVIVAVAGAMLLIVIVCVLLILLYRRKINRQQGVKTVVYHKDSKGRPDSMNMDATLQLPISLRRKPESPLPDVIHKPHMHGSAGVNGAPMVNMATHPSNRDSRDSTLSADGIAINCLNNMNSVQKKEWDAMMMRQAMEPPGREAKKDPQEAPPEYSSDPGELPPPPPYLLDEDQEEECGQHSTSYQDILDGYHSGENIDTTDDEQDYIQLPGYSHYSQHATTT